MMTFQPKPPKLNWHTHAGRIDVMRPETGTICAELIRVEQDCFKAWCNLVDGLGKLDPDAVVASQEPLHLVAESFRAWCLDDPAQAEAERLKLMRLQVEGEIRCEAGIKTHRGKSDRDVIRGAWTAERWRIVSYRDAITTGLGWPHRGERVTATITYVPGRDGQEVTVTGEGIYDASYDTHNTSHLMWMPQTGMDWQRGSRLVWWEPHERWGNADPAGDIAMRVLGALERRLPCPLPRWPKPEDIAGGIAHEIQFPNGEQLELL